MKFCSKCGKEINDEAVVCTNCGCAVNNISKANISSEEDIPSIGLNVLSLLIPLVGLILFCVTYSKTPTKAKSIGLFALIGWIIGIIIISASMM